MRLAEIYRTAFVTGASTGLGRAFAEAVPMTDVHPESKTVDVGFRMTAGPVVSVDRIEVKGKGAMAMFYVDEAPVDLAHLETVTSASDHRSSLLEVFKAP